MNEFDSRQHVMQACRDHDVKFIRLWFTDILGSLKSVAITAEELEHALDDGIVFDGSAIEVPSSRITDDASSLAYTPYPVQLLEYFVLFQVSNG